MKKIIALLITQTAVVLGGFGYTFHQINHIPAYSGITLEQMNDQKEELTEEIYKTAFLLEKDLRLIQENMTKEMKVNHGKATDDIITLEKDLHGWLTILNDNLKALNNNLEKSRDDIYDWLKVINGNIR